MTRRVRRTHCPAFNTKVALAPIKGARALAELAQQYDVHPTQITAWKAQPAEGAAGMFGSGSAGNSAAPAVDWTSHAVADTADRIKGFGGVDGREREKALVLSRRVQAGGSGDGPWRAAGVAGAGRRPGWPPRSERAMPPAFRNHLVPIGCDTPAATAASSLVIPMAMLAQKRFRSSRPAIGGRPGDGNGARPDRYDRRFFVPIATSCIRALQ